MLYKLCRHRPAFILDMTLVFKPSSPTCLCVRSPCRAAKPRVPPTRCMHISSRCALWPIIRVPYQRLTATCRGIPFRRPCAWRIVTAVAFFCVLFGPRGRRGFFCALLPSITYSCVDVLVFIHQNNLYHIRVRRVSGCPITPCLNELFCVLSPQNLTRCFSSPGVTRSSQ
jgi:hypothetical protein